MQSYPRFRQGVFAFEGKGIDSPFPIDAALAYTVPADSDGIAADLDRRMQESVDAYRDLWQEGAAPVTDGQFRPALPLRVLPLVPVREPSTRPPAGRPA